MVPKESLGQNGELVKLEEVRIVVAHISKVEKKLGLTKEDLKNHIFVFLRSKLPRLKVREYAESYIWIGVTPDYITQGASKTGVYGLVDVRVYSAVTIKTSKRNASVAIWVATNTFIGPLGDISTQVKEWLDRHLTKFAADWYRDNPSK